MAGRYKLGEIDNERFYMLSKELFNNPKYREISLTAKVVYSLLKDRMKLSRKNGWHDKNGDIYLLYPAEKIEKKLNLVHSTVQKALNELKSVDLIETVRQGLGKANMVYIKKFENQTSESMKNKLQEVQNSNTNDTESNETGFSDKEITKENPDSDIVNSIVSLYKEICKGMTMPRFISPKREKAILARFKDSFDKDLECVRLYFTKASTSKFLTGKVKDFRADLDFLMRKEVVLRIFEGQYGCCDSQADVQNQNTNNAKQALREMMNDGFFG